jgi:hypothetical protein
LRAFLSERRSNKLTKNTNNTTNLPDFDWEMDNAGFKLTECCIAMDFMVFNSEKKKKAVMLKWADGMYGISINGKKDKMHQIQFCPWCGSKLDKSGN